MSTPGRPMILPTNRQMTALLISGRIPMTKYGFVERTFHLYYPACEVKTMLKSPEAAYEFMEFAWELEDHGCRVFNVVFGHVERWFYFWDKDDNVTPAFSERELLNAPSEARPTC